jgi:hypothetical protein
MDRGSSAEATLSNFGVVHFSALTANGVNPGLTAAEAIQMVNSSDEVIANPSAPGAGGNSFDVCFGAGSCD